MSVEEIKANRRRLAEAVNKGWAAYSAALDELFTTDIVVHNARGEDVHGLENFKQRARASSTTPSPISM